MSPRRALALLLLLCCSTGAAPFSLKHLENGMWFRPSDRTRPAEFHLPSGELLPDYVGEGLPGNASLALYFVGDSLERYLMSSTCWVGFRQIESDYFGRALQPGCMGRWNNESKGCAVGSLAVGNLFFRGTLDESAHKLCEGGLPPTLDGIFEVGSAAFAAKYGSPQVVVLKSFFWEVNRLCYVTTFPCADMGGDAGAATKLLRAYEENVTAALRKLRALFPGAVVALKTDPLWNHTSNRFLGSAPHLNATNSVENAFWLGLELNKVIRRVAHKEIAPVFDFYRIFEGLSPREYLKDDIHLKMGARFASPAALAGPLIPPSLPEFSRVSVNMIVHTQLKSGWESYDVC